MYNFIAKSISRKMIRKDVRQSSSSIHSNSRAEIYEMPMNVIIRPFPAIVNEEKVQSLMSTLKNVETEHVVPPIDVLWIKGAEGKVSIYFI
jgi:sulfiredoxin